MLLGNLNLGAVFPGVAQEFAITLTNKTGTVWHTRSDQRRPDVANPPLALHTDDVIQTGTNSSAVVLVSQNNRLVRLWELSTLKVLPPEADSSPWLNLLHGALYLFSREKSNEVQIRTPHATGAPRGTEFVMLVDSNRTVLAMFDGSASFTNEWGATSLESGEMGIAEAGQPPIKLTLAATNLVQWWLYYPGVLDVDELEFEASELGALAASLQAYRSGDLAAALRAYPGYPAPTVPPSDAGRVYLAALRLAAGQVDQTESLLVGLKQDSSLAASLRWVISAVQGRVDQRPEVHTSASEWLGLSFYYQARHELPAALKAAQQAVGRSTNFAFGWERVAELEFSFGKIAAAKQALNRSLELAPLNAQAQALSGFLLGADGKFAAALVAFNRAMQLDASLGNAWLGRGLVRIRQGEAAAGRADLQMAAILEPHRSLLRSYLGKAFVEAGEGDKAALEFERAAMLDSKDPTPWLYSALLRKQQYRFNEGIADLEKSIALNDNRAVYRSEMLLDQDRAVRGANLATVYQNAGMSDISLNEASRAVTADYANYSAHLFLANSYNQLRDPNLVNLRYETATFSEYLLANLLAPVGGSALSPYVSQQEYSRLFEHDRLGFSSETTYLSRGDWQQQASQYGWCDHTSYAFDVFYRSQDGEQPNTDLQQQAYSIQLKQQLTPQDSIYAQAIFSDYDAGDVRQFYDPRAASPSLRATERQTPNLFVGYHHEWSPGLHTLLLAGRLEDKFSLSEQNFRIRGVVRDATGAVVDTVEEISRRFGVDPPSAGDTFDALKFRSEFEAYSVELQQIAELSQHTLTLGVRYQDGQTKTTTEQTRSGGRFPPYDAGFNDFVAGQQNSTDLTRLNFYAYDQWHVFNPLWLVAGLSYDQLHFPWNIDLAPVSSEERNTSQLLPKAGFIWTPTRATTIRGAYTRSLGGVFYDSSVRLEPVQIAGFNQAYRSLISESIEGGIPGSHFQTFDLGLEHRFKSRTYVFAQAELLQSEAIRDAGVFDFDPNGNLNATPSQIRQQLDYEEQALVLGLNQLLGTEWSLGARYKVSQADLKTRYPDVPTALIPDVHNRAVLQDLKLFAIYNHRCGFFAEAQALWYDQGNYHYDPELKGDSFWQFNLFAGYRFPRQRAEVTVGLLNLADQDYRLNPLNPHPELPRERTLLVSLKLNF